MATQTSPSFAGLTVPEDDIWFDKALQDELDQKARGEKQTSLPFGFLHGLGAAPFEQNINIGGPGYSAVPPQRSGLTVDEQNVSSFQMPFGFFQHAIAPGSFSPMHLGWQENIQEAKERDVTPASWMNRAGTEERQGGWDVMDAGFDLADVVPGGQILGYAGDISKVGKILPEFSSMLAGVMPQQARNLLKGSKVVDTEDTPTRVYHGTKGIFSEFSPEYQDSGSMLGRGFYFTESPEIAGGYSTNKGWIDPDTGKYGGAPNVHSNYLNLQKPLDMEGVAKEDIITKMADKLFTFSKELEVTHDVARRQRHLQEMTARIYNFMASPVIRDFDSMEQFEKALNIGTKEAGIIQELIANRQWDKAEKAITQFFKKSVRTNNDVFSVMTAGDNFYPKNPNDAWTDGLEELGYDGITHIGGMGAGPGNVAHRVWIVFDKDHIFDAGALEGMHKLPESLPPSGDFSKMLKDMFGKGMGR